MDFVKIDANLGSKTTNSHINNMNRFFIGRYEDDVVDEVVFEPIGTEIFVKKSFVVGGLGGFDFEITNESQNCRLKRLVEPID